MPTSFVALPHSTGNTVADATPAASARASSAMSICLVAEVALHEVVVADDDALDERVVHRVLFGLHLVGHRALGALRRAARVGDGDVVQQIDDARERFASSPIGSCNGATPAPNFAFSSSSVRENDARSRSSLFTKIAREAALLGELPRDLGLHLDAFDRGHDEQREVGRLDRGGDVADEVGVAGRVEHVDLVVFELERCERERHRDVAALLLGVEVAHGRAVLDPAQADDRPGVEQEGLGQRGLAGAAVADECDVADLRGRKRLHR